MYLKYLNKQCLYMVWTRVTTQIYANICDLFHMGSGLPIRASTL